MAKKNEIEKLSPGICLESLRAYNQAVFLLVNTLSAVLDQIGNGKIRDMVSYQLDEVKSFYL